MSWRGTYIGSTLSWQFVIIWDGEIIWYLGLDCTKTCIYHHIKHHIPGLLQKFLQFCHFMQIINIIIICCCGFFPQLVYYSKVWGSFLHCAVPGCENNHVYYCFCCMKLDCMWISVKKVNNDVILFKYIIIIIIFFLHRES